MPNSSCNQLLTYSQVAQTIAPKMGEKRWLGGLKGCGLAYFCSQFLHQTADKKQSLLVVVANNHSQAQQLEQELRFFDVPVQVFADWEILPYDRMSPHQDIVSERLGLLSHFPNHGVVIIAVQNAIQRIAPPQWVLGQHFSWQVGQKFDINQERQRLSTAGYRAVETVFEPGEYAIRGSLMDVYPTGQQQPLRIELFDDEIETIRTFDPETQRSHTESKITAFTVLPAQEFPLVEGKNRFKNNWHSQFVDNNPKRSHLYQDVSDGIHATGIESYLPLFFDNDTFVQSGHIFAYIPPHAVLISDAHIDAPLQHFYADVNSRYQDRKHDIDQPILQPQALYLEENELNTYLNQFARIITSENEAPERAGAYQLHFPAVPQFYSDQKTGFDSQALAQFVAQINEPTLFVAESLSRRETLKEVLASALHDPIKTVDNWHDYQAQSANTTNPPHLSLTHASLSRGLVCENACIITEGQLYGLRVQQSRRRNKKQDSTSEFLVRSLAELTIGAPVVHIDHGVGRYAGLTNLEIEGQTYEFLQIDYADNAKIYVPVSNLGAISRYSGGDPEHAPLHKLGSDQWSKAKRKATESVHDVAAELLNIQARRVAKPGFAFYLDEHDYALFAAQFPFEETIDQQNAIDAVLHDMCMPKPMDRLVCGDVGFGKTEVAMRAAFLAVHNHKQVAVLVPTTLLAQQHYENFKERFANWPVRIEVLSRFGSKKDHNQVLEDIQTGQVDIVIGTHKLLQQDVHFKQLGLMVVDEEHRFGVRDKEKIKALRADVDMLTMTATPIPRTLNMAFSGMRDLSIIATPPARRLAVKTFVVERSKPTLKEAILRELLRGGQVYFLHNEVETMEQAAEEIRQLIPEARVATAHGQMRERQLEHVMQAFYHKDYNILVCSTIIETGIDVPNANTIIIERADKLGLAQLHQLRGRVGRSHHQAYAYLLVPSIKHLKGDAEKRLDAISRASDLGAGFVLATEDMEIRGAGELLGEEQSGHMQAVGFSVYMDMLERATKAIAQGKAPNLDAPLSLTADINLHLPALIPDDYLPDPHHRLLFYKRISAAHHKDGLLDLKHEITDRYGLLPQPTLHLFEVHQLRLLCENLKIEKIDVGAKGGFIEFSPDTTVEAIKIIKLLQSKPNHFRMEGGQRLKLTMTLADPQERIQTVKNVLQELMP